MAAPRRSLRFPLICASAYAGSVIGYLPLLTLLLPIHVAAIVGGHRYAVLAAISAIGSVVAGGGNVVFGALSDRSRRRGGGRRRWIAAGLVATLASFALLPSARTPAALIVAISAFQLALNALMAPVSALVAEEVSADRIGVTTGLFAAGAPVASLLPMAFALPGIASETARLAVIGLAMTACLVPLIVARGGSAGEATPPPPSRAVARRDLTLAWSARLLVQIAGNVIFVDLLYLLADGVGGGAPSVGRMGSLLLVANLVPLPVAVLLGRWSDGRGRRRRPVLVALATIAAAGLTAMAAAPDQAMRFAGFLLFSVGWSAFLALQVGYIFRLLPDPDHRGRDLGIVNLANTLPVLVGQGLTALIAAPGRPAFLLASLAALTFCGGLVMLGVRDVSRTPESP